MELHQKELFAQLTKVIAGENHQFGGGTICKQTSNGWINAEEVFKLIWRSILIGSERIIIKGYQPNWLDDIPMAEHPKWASIIDDNIIKSGQNLILSNAPEVVDELFNFWMSPWVYYKSKSSNKRASVLPAIPLIEIRLDAINADAVFRAVEFFASVSNPWAGGYESTGKWINQQYTKGEYLYIPFRRMDSLHFFGASELITQLVDAVLCCGLLEEIEEHVPGYWQDEVVLEKHETVEKAVDRLRKIL